MLLFYFFTNLESTKIVIFYSILYLFCSCASQSSLTGGKKDTIPPTLIASIPKNNSTNFKNKKIILTFSESIQEKNLKNNLIITPNYDNTFQQTISNKTLILSFRKNWKDSTTYTLNFNNTIADTREKNEAKNLTLSFSTGNTIDTLSINGVVTDLMNNKSINNATVSLFYSKDTCNILNCKPLYLAYTNEKGFFRITNIKKGYYILFAFEDKNKNSKAEPDTEPSGFIKDTLQIEQNTDSLKIKLSTIDIRPIKKIFSKANGTYFDVKYNKPLVKCKVIIAKQDSLKQPKYRYAFVENKTTVRFYNRTKKFDSAKIILQVFDTTFCTKIDTFFLKFQPSKKQKTPFYYSLNPNNKTEELQKIFITFSKPLLLFNWNKVFITYDSVPYKQPLDTSHVIWNENKNIVSFMLKLNKNFIRYKTDSLKKEFSKIEKDTASPYYTTIKKKINTFSKIKENSFYISFQKQCIISIDLDTPKTQSFLYSFYETENYGIISGKINTSQKKYILQLINKDYKVIQDISHTKDFTFSLIPPGDYSFRILIDSNENGIWENANIIEKRQHEPVFFYDTFINIRANWTIDNINITF